jgi:sulfhydrogenase subunit gamma (sulfur reductase)
MTDVETNAYFPHLGKLVEVKNLADEIKMLRVELINGGWQAFAHSQPGQFAFLSAFGCGEAPFGIASIPNHEPVLDFAINRIGTVTTGLHELGEGDLVGLRGPMGNWFPMDEFTGKDLVVLGGGIGGAPLRPVIQHVLSQRPDYGRLTILWAARRPSLLIFTDEFDSWREAPDTFLHLTVDEPDEKWDSNIGLITELLERVNPAPDNTVTITCGPPVMIYYVTQMLAKKGFSPAQNYVTLEARMHCGIGKCGRCNLGEKLVCRDGPVFSMAEVGNFLDSYL